MAAGAVVLSYSLWAFERNGNSSVWFEVSIVPFTIAILRYAVLVDSGDAGEPEEIARHDYRLQVQAAAWLATLGAAIVLV
jgi:decaprenyl-phosphate phosphoribosyltransferase